MSISWIGALKLVPWADVIEATPALVQTARRVLGKPGPDAQAAAHETLAQRVTALEAQHAELAELVGQLTQHNLSLVAAMDGLQRRMRLLALCAGIAGAACIAGLIALALR
ncbi:MAG: hypothetical protein J7556_05910 [Acidovorax sp.]|nr:hypothetical protein [Acidovorax sp.]